MLQGVSICTKTESQAWKGCHSSFIHTLKKNDMETKKPEKGNTVVNSL